MRRRFAFTLIEMLVSVALVLFIMVILTEAFGKGLDSFRTLKAVGDMESRLRTASALLRRDLQADHFEGKRRLSDPNARWTAMGVPREGFFHIQRNFVAGGAAEGNDSDGLVYRREFDCLYFTVKLRGNNRSEFFQANVGNSSPLMNPQVRSNFFDQPTDARFQDSTEVYSGQWGEVLYVPVETSRLGNIRLSTLYRGQLVVVADNSRLNWPSTPPVPGMPLAYSQAQLDQHKEMSCYWRGNDLYFNNPTDLALPAGRTLQFTNPTNATRQLGRWSLTPVLTDVISFDVEYLRHDSTAGDGTLNLSLQNGEVDSSARGNPITAIRIYIRVWDPKTKQARQMTVFQEM